ncbi:MAG: hypothetical protein ABSD48_06675 [Armatimonadota bacterium]|jgi:hypothetical protein
MSIPKPEWRWPAIFAAILMLLTCLPYVFGVFLRQPGWYYSGFILSPIDPNVYLAYMRQARDGHLFLTDLFTTEPQPGRFIDLFWLTLGLSARVTHLALPIVYHIARVISGWLLLMAVYWLSAQVIPTVWGRRLAVALTATASGVGWLFHTHGLQLHPIDYGPGLVMPEAITFLTLLISPLFSFSTFLIIVIYGFAVHAFATGSVRSTALAGLAALVLGNIHGYDIIPVAPIIALYVVVQVVTRRAALRALRLLALIGAIAAPSVLYQYWLQTIGDMTVVAKFMGPTASSPPMRWFALGLGLPLFLAAIAAVRGFAKGNDATRLLVVWLVVGFAAVFAPVPFNRKLAEGLHIPVCVLAVLAFERLLRSAPRRMVFVGAGFILLCLPSNALFLHRAMNDLITNNQRYLGGLTPPVYLRPDQYDALRFLEGRVNRFDILLANPFLANYAPSLSGVRVYLGHWSETLRYRGKIGQASIFLQAGTSDAERKAFFRKRRITYLLRDRSVYDDALIPLSLGAGGPFDPDHSPWLSKVYQRSHVAVYRVR